MQKKCTNWQAWSAERRPTRVMAISRERERPVGGSECLYEKFTWGMWDVHFYLEIGVVLEGRVRRYLCGKYRDVETGDMWFAGPWEPHGTEILECPSHVIALSVRPDFLINTRLDFQPEADWYFPFRESREKRLRWMPERPKACLDIWRRIAEGLKPEGNPHVLPFLLFELLLELGAGTAPRRDPLDVRGRPYELVGKAVEHVLASSCRISEAEEASRLGVSVSALRGHFRRIMGLSFARFALSHRLSRAAQQLAGTDHPIKRVAADWGFANAAHFQRAFRAQYGCSAGEYRQHGAASGPASP